MARKPTSWRSMDTAPKDALSSDVKYRILVKTVDGAIHVVRWTYVDVEATPIDWCVAPDLGYIEGGWHHICKPIAWQPLPSI